MNFYKPVDKYWSHLFIYISLILHVSRSRQMIQFNRFQMIKDFFHIFWAQRRFVQISQILIIKFLTLLSFNVFVKFSKYLFRVSVTVDWVLSRNAWRLFIWVDVRHIECWQIMGWQLVWSYLRWVILSHWSLSLSCISHNRIWLLRINAEWSFHSFRS